MKKNVIITGGSTSLGAKIAEALYNDYNVVVVDKLEPEHKFYHHFVSTILSTYTHYHRSIVDALFDHLIEQDIYPDIWVNNAGVTSIDWFENVSMVDYDTVLDINLKVPVRIMQELVRQYSENVYNHDKFAFSRESNKREKIIINIVSMSSLMPLRCSLPYNISKAGLAMATKQIVREIAGRHKDFKIFAISPNTLGESGMVESLVEPMVAKRGFKGREDVMAYTQGSPLGHMQDMTEISTLVKFLCDNPLSYLSGSNILSPGALS